MVTVTIGNTQRDNKCLSSCTFISRHCMMVYFSFSNLIGPQVLEAIGMEHCKELTTPTKVEAPLGKDSNIFEAKIYCLYSYDSVI